MAEETWRSWGLSSHVQSVSKAAADLQSSLLPHVLTDETVKALEVLKSELQQLRIAVGLHGPPNASASENHTISSPVVKKLAESAAATLWDEIPLRAVADEHKHRADRFQDDGERTAEVYVGYQKYLQLFPGPKDGPEFRQLNKRIRALERILMSKGNDDNGCQSPPVSDSKKAIQPGVDNGCQSLSVPDGKEAIQRGFDNGCQSSPSITHSGGKKAVQPGVKAEKEKGWWSRRGNGMHGSAKQYP